MKQTMKDLAIYLLELGNGYTYEEAYAMIDTTYQRFQKDLSTCTMPFLVNYLIFCVPTLHINDYRNGDIVLNI